MERKFECGNEVLLRATVCAVHDKGSVYDYDVYYLDHDTGEFARISVIEEQLATAGKISDDLASKLHEAETEITSYKEILERIRNHVNELESTLADYRYIFEYMPEWREYILHEMCQQWRALEE